MTCPSFYLLLVFANVDCGDGHGEIKKNKKRGFFIKKKEVKKKKLEGIERQWNCRDHCPTFFFPKLTTTI